MIDLHSHTNESDGTCSPAQLVEEAVRAGVRVLGITDHDTLSGFDKAVPVGREAGIELTAREFALLEYLMRRAGQVVPKAELLEHVWDPDPDSVTDMNVVEVYAGYLRRKIDVPFGKNALQTVRGAGYRLAADGG